VCLNGADLVIDGMRGGGLAPTKKQIPSGRAGTFGRRARSRNDIRDAPNANDGRQCGALAVGRVGGLRGTLAVCQDTAKSCPDWDACSS